MQQSYPLITILTLCANIGLQLVRQCQLKTGTKINGFILNHPCVQVISGRPYRGVGFVCDQIAGLDYKIIESDCDRI